MEKARKMSVKQISDELDAITNIWREIKAGLAPPNIQVAERYDELEEELSRRRDAGTAA